jgi:hypothetical protein
MRGLPVTTPTTRRLQKHQLPKNDEAFDSPSCGKVSRKISDPVSASSIQLSWPPTGNTSKRGFDDAEAVVFFCIDLRQRKTGAARLGLTSLCFQIRFSDAGRCAVVRQSGAWRTRPEITTFWGTEGRWQGPSACIGVGGVVPPLLQ